MQFISFNFVVYSFYGTEWEIKYWTVHAPGKINVVFSSTVSFAILIAENNSMSMAN